MAGWQRASPPLPSKKLALQCEQRSRVYASGVLQVPRRWNQVIAVICRSVGPAAAPVAPAWPRGPQLALSPPSAPPQLALSWPSAPPQIIRSEHTSPPLDVSAAGATGSSAGEARAAVRLPSFVELRSLGACAPFSVMWRGGVQAGREGVTESSRTFSPSP
ncbi:unnamed protein product [Arctogadus glacialis]